MGKDGQASEGLKPKYKSEQSEYAVRYGQSDRTIKRWVRTGKDAGDFPPLDFPAEMPAWWARNYRHKVPLAMLEAARAAAVVGGGDHAERPAVEARGGQVSSLDAGSGFAEMLNRVRDAERVAYIEYDVALKSGDEARLPLARKTWGELSKQLRELERDAHDILSRSGNLVEKAVVERLVAEIHVPIVNGMRSMWRRVRAQILAVAEGQQDRVWQEEVDRLLTRLADSGFTAYE